MGNGYKILRTLSINNTDALAARVGTETLVVCGAPRGMTSLVAYSLYQMGYFLGDDLNPRNYEDNDVLNAMPPARWFYYRQIDKRPQFRDLVARRNQNHLRWGFKLPHATGHVPGLIRALRNPVFVVCVRNPVAVARSVANRERPFNGRLRTLHNIGISYLPALDTLLKSRTVPTVMINMDAVEHSPGIFLKELTGALELTGDLDAIKARIKVKGYKEITSPP